ncbi:indolepyruvate ferredoxin oxidoreductase subunit alpha [Candidatus Contubernalis alkaliaceticus]|uniref:indolepyruvate ferredoxin oxidoreductase subunit alpha n=1 Tax=Candidatus Contubernalis alkaliaceticus TaxID=338645 RepID=UPI001F4C0049|nr:indolepyruvate ferredoxin oxidoreductase subunit alpha [Candidatus Contubernalis alkalaceticus]UNC93418.1 indolepyruvate ferredoxin oxidoreductase subunit alpha [Candidatus Contubernalis alkalaceticus]
MKKAILTGNEAIARGAYEHGVKVAAAYPGTPSTEILENITKYEDIYAQWSCNEKVALEVGIGSSLAGARTLVAMKHVGVNVAADPLMTFAYTGVNGGMVLISADDPGMHSSQNEQDNRLFARFAKVPLLEPSDSQEAKDFVGAALNLSEQFDVPVMLRTTTRIAHSMSEVTLGERVEEGLKPYHKASQKYVMIPAYARVRHQLLEEKLVELKQFSQESNLNRIEWGDREIGVITSGICYQYVKEALPDASCLKLGMPYPFPEKLVREFAAGVKKLYVVEELEPFLEEEVKVLGLEAVGKEIFPLTGEINASMILERIGGKEKPAPLTLKDYSLEEIPMRPPVMCAGCPHRGVFYILKKLDLIVTGDIGCYTLGCLPPLDSMDSCICMGASIGTALGMEKADPTLKGRVVAVIGDSTFFHSGLTGTLDVVYNLGSSTLIILDNRTTAMTGHQDHPGTGRTLKKEPGEPADLEGIVKALGIDRVVLADPLNLEEVERVVSQEIGVQESSVIIFRSPCALTVKEKDAPAQVNEECVYCTNCVDLGCPAMVNDTQSEEVRVTQEQCTGCGLCIQVCDFDAIEKAGEAGE